MATFPPSTVVKNESTFKAVANGFRLGGDAASDALANLAVWLHPVIVNTLRKHGLDGTNRLGLGSDAKKAADSVVGPLHRAAQNFSAGGALVGFAYLAFVKNVVTPIEIAKRQQEGGDTLDI